MTKNRTFTFIRIIEFFGDLFLELLGLHLAFKASGLSVFPLEENYKVFTVYVLLFLFFFYLFDLYKDKSRAKDEVIVSVFFSTLASVFGTLLFNVLLSWEYSSFSTWIYLFLITLALLEAWRMFTTVLFNRFKKKERTVILESIRSDTALARKLKYSSPNIDGSWYYMIDDENEEEVDSFINTILPLHDAVVISPKLSRDASDKILTGSLLLHKQVSIPAQISDIYTLNARTSQYSDTVLIVKNGIVISTFEKFIKRVFDIVSSLIALILCAPLFLACTIWIRLDSKGPAFYKQERYTIGKKKFFVYKFRTMCENAEKDGAMLSTKDDERITRVGKILRSLRIDELPQLINILRGEMSVVGPRPERPVFADEYSKTVKNYDLRYLVKAGLTGYAQVYGKYNTKAEDKILMDLIYEVNFSLMLDFKIIMLTLKTVFMSSAAEGVDTETEDMLNTQTKESRRAEYSNLLAKGTMNASSAETEERLPKVSVIIPAYNCGQYIDRCINSMFEQNYPNLEIVVVNDGSTDGTAEKLRAYDEKIKLIDNETNLGVAHARNLGLEHSTGDLLLFLDSDDALVNNTIPDLVRFRDETKTDIVHFAYKIIKDSGEVSFSENLFRTNGTVPKEKFKKEVYPCFINGISLNSVCCAMYSRSCVEGITFPTGMKTAEDAIFNVRAYTKANSVSSISIPYYCYYRHKKSLTSTGLSVREKAKYNKMLSKEIKKHLKEWKMNNLYWRVKVSLRPAVILFDKIIRKI
ncbi:MAG: exopolysaccharide biosynthesis polyprenyl glycosylphosphotransferase [Clostridia bacterium]|nr:exopolysaccharide biosynthesis polyprenyl glycosylphosphotransferase [Clostridia bacterium]